MADRVYIVTEVTSDFHKKITRTLQVIFITSGILLSFDEKYRRLRLGKAVREHQKS